MSSGRRSLRRNSRRRHRQQPASESPRVNGVQQVVDLTCDDSIFDDHNSEQFVDLTDTPVNGSMPVNRNNLQSPYLVSDGSLSDDDLPPVPFKITAKPRRKPPVNSGETGVSDADTSAKLVCPVCLDSASEVKATGRRLMATTCGHVFCEECVKGILNNLASGRNCPTCRKKLSARSVHPLFI